ncbi:MAG TPA: hypothetical protein VLL54_16635 [Pyrinomonadaceae bacterium]|nr:hypothetical protein [Pyrinomonadaceae bacterium]
MCKFILGATLVLLACAGASAQDTASTTTRFGDLTVSEDGVLLFKGGKVQPTVEANNNLDIGEPFQIGNADVVLVTDYGGTACPATYYFVTVTNAGAKVTPGFGSCSDLIKVKRTGNTISVSMPGYRGPTMPRRSQNQAAREKHVFIYRAGVVTENGKPVK